MIKNTAQSYGSLSKLLHWSMALLMIALLTVGLYMTGLPSGDDKWYFYDLHKSFGMVVFLLAFLRVLWRYVSPAPQPLESLPNWQKSLSRISHFGLMAFLVLFPLSGLLMSIMAGYSVKIFGSIEIPAVTGGETAFASIAHGFHVWMPYFAIGLICVHVAAAFYHHFFEKDDVLRRMI